MKRYLPFAIIVAVLLIALGSWALLMRSSRRAGSTTQQASSSSPGSPSAAASGSPLLNASNGAPGAEPPHVRGETNAPVTIEEFGDYQCPPCGALHPELKRIESEYGARLRIIFRNYPLTKIHEHALEAAHAAEAADMQGRFWAMHDLLYENQPMWSKVFNSRPIFINYARSLGLDVDRFTRDMDGPKADARVTADMKRGDSIGVKATPTVFVNNREVPAANMTPDGLRAAINAALNGKSQ